MKTYKTELQNEAVLDDLVGGNPVSQNPALGCDRRVSGNQGGISRESRAVVPRYKFYKYSEAFVQFTVGVPQP